MSAFDWPALMRAGMHGLRLTPDQFWKLTPAELSLMLGIGTQHKALGREQLNDLIRAFPDVAINKEQSDG